MNKGSDTREPVAGLRGTEEGREDKPGKESWRSSGGVLTAPPAMAALGVEELSSLGAFFR